MEDKKNARAAEEVKELTPEELDGALGGDSAFDDVPRVDEHPYQPGEPDNL
jgi:hypothetical protein